MILELGRPVIQKPKSKVGRVGEREDWQALCTSAMPRFRHLLLTFVPGASAGRMMQLQLLGHQGCGQECSHVRGGRPELALGDTGVSMLWSRSPLPQPSGLCLTLSLKHIPPSSLPTHILGKEAK